MGVYNPQILNNTSWFWQCLYTQYIQLSEKISARQENKYDASMTHKKTEKLYGSINIFYRLRYNINITFQL